MLFMLAMIVLGAYFAITPETMGFFQNSALTFDKYRYGFFAFRLLIYLFCFVFWDAVIKRFGGSESARKDRNKILGLLLVLDVLFIFQLPMKGL